MKNAGYVLIVLGFLMAALAAVVDELQVAWGTFAIALAVGAIGVMSVRLATRQEARAEGKLALSMHTLDESLRSVVQKITTLDRQKESLDPYEARMHIDELFPDDLNAFVLARESIAHVHGLQAYADVMNRFAAGERYLNRVWSASADGYIDEVRTYLGKAAHEFGGALEELERVEQPAA
jgi:hypothetical protein